MSTESPHQRVARQTGPDLRRNERMIDAVQGLSRQLAETERTLQTFISALSSSIEPAERSAAPDSRQPAEPARGPDPVLRRDAPAGIADHVLPGTRARRDDVRAGTDGTPPTSGD